MFEIDRYYKSGQQMYTQNINLQTAKLLMRRQLSKHIY